MKDDIQNYLDRPKRYHNIDGTGEIFMGLMMLAYALIGFLEATLPKESFWQQHSLLFIYSVLLPVLGLGWLLQKVIKRTVTWPRTGYVAFPGGAAAIGGRMVWPFALGVVIAAVVVLVFVPLALIGKTHHLTMSVTRLFYAAFFVAPYAFWVSKMCDGQRWKWFVVAFMALGLIVLGLSIPGGLFDSFFPWVALFVGLTWSVSGGATLVHYIRHNPRPASQAE
jgi:hypothetical protein